MSFMETFYRLERLAHLIQRKGTGNRQELAEKLGVAVRTVDNLLLHLRSLTEVEILYCRERGSYYFAQPVKISFDFIISLDGEGEIHGGQKFISIFSPAAEFLRREALSLYC